MALRLITEDVDQDLIEVLCESAGAEKTYRIRCPVMVADMINRNNRIYSEAVCDRSTAEYTQNRILKRDSVGEYLHSTSPIINRERAAIMMESISKNGKDYIGTAKILTKWPLGKIVHNMIEEKMPTGISSRSLGTLNETTRYVNNDLVICAYDIVTSPSCQKAVVDSLMEESFAQYVMEGDQIVEVAMNKFQKQLDKHGSRVALSALQDFLRSIK